MIMIKLNAIKMIQAELHVVSGLRIGAGDTEIHIGGVDNTVIKHPITQLPYIPGSSLKGKVRSLLEWKTGAVKEAPLGRKDLVENHPAYNEIKAILQLFGTAADDAVEGKDQMIMLSRLAFWDCGLQESWVRQVEDNSLSFVEVKAENSINRTTGAAKSPRMTERVPEGSIFDFNLALKVFEDDDEKALLETTLQGLRLLELDSLGGSGSRGYGKVKFKKLKIAGNLYHEGVLDALDPFAR